MPDNRKGFASALHIRGLRQRWMFSAVLPILLLLVLAVALFSVGVQEYYYNAMRSGLESRARIAAETFTGYGVKSYSEYYRLASYSAETFEEKDRLELQFISPGGKIVASSYGKFAGRSPSTPEIQQAIDSQQTRHYKGRNPLTGERILAVSSPMIYTNGEVIGVLSRMTTVVSMRLHGLIFAAGQGVPLIGVAYDPKVTAFLDYVEQNNYMQFEALNEKDLSDLIDSAVALAGRGEELRRRTELLNRQEDNNRATAARLLGKE